MSAGNHSSDTCSLRILGLPSIVTSNAVTTNSRVPLRNTHSPIRSPTVTFTPSSSWNSRTKACGRRFTGFQLSAGKLPFTTNVSARNALSEKYPVGLDSNAGNGPGDAPRAGVGLAHRKSTEWKKKCRTAVMRASRPMTVRFFTKIAWSVSLVGELTVERSW